MNKIESLLAAPFNNMKTSARCRLNESVDPELAQIWFNAAKPEGWYGIPFKKAQINYKPDWSWFKWTLRLSFVTLSKVSNSARINLFFLIITSTPILSLSLSLDLTPKHAHTCTNTHSHTRTHTNTHSSLQLFCCLETGNNNDLSIQDTGRQTRSFQIKYVGSGFQFLFRRQNIRGRFFPQNSS